MKVFKRILFCFGCLGMFLIAGVLSCAIRAKYRCVPELKSTLAYSYADLVSDYSFVEYNQADSQRGELAMLNYLEVLRKIQSEKIHYPQNKLHFECGLTYLRLYRIELAENKTAEAASYMTSAQDEFAALGWNKEALSADNLAKRLSSREASENKNFNNMQVAPVASSERTPRPLEVNP